MRSEIYILCILLLINTFLTIYLVYHCFKSPIVEGLDVIGAIKSGVNDGLSAAERELQRLKELEIIATFFGKVVKSLDSLYSSLKNTTKTLKDFD